MVHITTRVCAKCKKEKNIDDFYFFMSKGHFDCYCKECKKTMASDWQRTKPERQKEINERCVSKKENEAYLPVGGWKMSVLNHTKKNEYKYTALNTDGQFYQTNSKEDFINFIKEKI